MNKTGYIYKITSPTGKIYIGKTTRLNDRISCYRNGDKNKGDKQRIISNSIKKYGWENHIFEIIDKSSPEKLSELEVYYIQKYNSYHHDNKNGMNLTKGGEGSLGRKDSLETKQKRANSIKGRKHSEQTKQLMSILKKGKPSNKKNIPCSEEAKKKIGQANKGRIKTEETLNKMKDTRLLNLVKKHGAILQIDKKTDQVIKEWVMLPKDIGKHFTTSDSNITKCLKKQVKYAYKYKWRYKNE